MKITPGIYDLPDEEYHADPVDGGSLSSTGARTLANRTPAEFAYERAHGRPDTKVFDFGRAAHRHVLSAGADIAVIDHDSWRTKDARDQAATARDEGRIPVLVKDHTTVRAMADALRAHPTAGPMLDPERGAAERSLFWIDPRSGVWCRARLDWLPDHLSGGGRLLVADYKTAETADPNAFGRAAAAYGYHQQAAWYLAGIKALGLAQEAAFLFIVQSKRPPHLVSVCQLDATALAIGAHLNRQALGVYAACAASGVWPGYPPEVHLVNLPAHIERAYDEEIYR